LRDGTSVKISGKSVWKTMGSLGVRLLKMCQDIKREFYLGVARLGKLRYSIFHFQSRK